MRRSTRSPTNFRWLFITAPPPSPPRVRPSFTSSSSGTMHKTTHPASSPCLDFIHTPDEYFISHGSPTALLPSRSMVCHRAHTRAAKEEHTKEVGVCVCEKYSEVDTVSRRERKGGSALWASQRYKPSATIRASGDVRDRSLAGTCEPSNHGLLLSPSPSPSHPRRSLPPSYLRCKRFGDRGPVHDLRASPGGDGPSSRSEQVLHVQRHIVRARQKPAGPSHLWPKHIRK